MVCLSVREDNPRVLAHVTTGARNMPIQYIRFALFVANNAKHISLRKLFDLFCSIFKDIIPGATTPTF